MGRRVFAGVVGVMAALIAAVACGGSGSAGDDFDLDGGQPSEPTEHRLEWSGGGGTAIGGTLTLPVGESIGGAVIIPGFGAIDRDQVMVPDTTDRSADRLSQDLNYSRPGVGDSLFEDLADSLAATGIATVRYDKRGSGRSQIPADQALSLEDLVQDAKGALDLLVQHRATSGKPVVLVGHDQGALVALRLAGHPGVAGVVAVSPFGRPLAKVIGDDLVATRGPVSGKVQSDQLQQVAATLREGGGLPAPADLHGNLRALLLPFQESYLRAIFSVDPEAEAGAVTVPVLVVRGASDSTTTGADLDLLMGALPAGSEPMTVVDADHNLRVDGVRDEGALVAVANWTAARVSS